VSRIVTVVAPGASLVGTSGTRVSRTHARYGARTVVLGLLAAALSTSAEGDDRRCRRDERGYLPQTPFNSSSQRKVVRDSSGACFVVYTQTTTDREVRISRSSDCDTNWQAFTVFGSSTAGEEFLYRRSTSATTERRSMSWLSRPAPSASSTPRTRTSPTGMSRTAGRQRRQSQPSTDWWTATRSPHGLEARRP